MGRIRILPDILSNKIAAGEVVERPASAVKELVENALDAGSSRISIEVEEGGRNAIRVSDNGSGMSPDDALLAIERYATSKIADDRDLFSIRSLGFRGEALPSMAAVSRLTLTSRENGAATGTEIRVEGGRVIGVVDKGAPQGTQVSVRQLFYNVPARRKFMRAAATELGHVVDLLAALVLAWPRVQFSLRHNGRDLRLWSAVSDPCERVADVLGREVGGDLWPLKSAEGDRALHGVIAHPRRFRTSPRGIHLFVNGRWVRDRGIQHALLEAYSGHLMRGQFPLAALFLDLPFDQVDVNVHPTKSEVRFLDSRPVHALVLAAAREALQRMGRPGRTPETDPRPAPERQAERIGEATEAHPAFALPLQGASPGVAESATPSGASVPAGGGFRDNRPLAGRAPAQEKIWNERPLEALRVIGQFQNTYLICEAPGDLVLIDQHAAHERIIYERLQSAHQGSGGQRQALLLPETVELNHREAARIEELMPELERLGLELEPFGGGTFAVKAVPAPLAGGEVAPLVMQIAEKALDSHAEGGLERAIQESLVLMACHGAIRAHQALSPAEATALLQQLEACATPSCCPHGRPTLIRWPLAALEKMFKRIA